MERNVHPNEDCWNLEDRGNLEERTVHTNPLAALVLDMADTKEVEEFGNAHCWRPDQPLVATAAALAVPWVIKVPAAKAVAVVVAEGPLRYAVALLARVEWSVR